MNKFSKFISTLLCISVICTGLTFGIESLNGQSAKAATTTTAATITTAYDYPVKPGSTEWKNLKNHSERLAACQIPDTILKNMTTDALEDTVLNYPFLMDIMAFDSYEKGVEVVSKNFNGLSELLSRQDGATKLLEKYKKMDITTDANNSKEVFKMANLEIILSQDQIKNKLSETEKTALENEAENKYLKKKEHTDVYSDFTKLAYYKTAVQKMANSTQSTKSKSAKSTETISTQSTGPISTLRYNTYVYTPNGTAVPVIVRGEELSSTDKYYMDLWVTTYYPNVDLLRSATTNYNCHSYAWYSTSYTNTKWMNYPTAYMTDGSYYSTSMGVGRKIYYGNGGHSGIVYSTFYPFCRVTSKWGPYGLVRHINSECPYIGSPFSYWKR